MQVGMPFFAAAAAILRPVAVLPVKLILARAGLALQLALPLVTLGTAVHQRHARRKR